MRFCSFPNRRRAIPDRTLWSRHRLLLETLEDRVLPSIADGTLLVATGPSSFSSENQSSFPIGIIGVNPHTGAQTPISTGGLFSLPTYITEAPNQQLYVTDLTAFGTGAIIAVDPNSGQQTVVAKGGFINGPNVLSFVNGYLYVADEGDSSGTVHNIVRIDPNTGQQTLVTDGSSGGFTVPVGMAPAPGNSLYVADEPGNVQGSDPGKIWLVSLDTGQQTIVSSNNSSQGMLFNHPVDITLDANGNLIVGNTGSASNSYSGSILRVNPQTGVQKLISSFGADTGLDSVEVSRDGTILVGAISSGSTPGRIYTVNPGNGAQGVLASDQNLSLVEGIRVFHVTANSATTVVSAVNPSVSGQSVTLTATVSVSGSSNPTGVVTFFDGSTSLGQGTLSTTAGVTTASFSTTALTPAAHVLTATYQGDPNYNTSTSAPLTLTVNKANTNMAVASTASASASGQSLIFTATVTVNAPGSTAFASPTGTVTFSDNGNSLGQGTLSTSGGTTTASFTTSGLTGGSHTITASYGGDSNFLASSASLTQTINQAATTTTVLSSANPSVSGQMVTFTATVTGGGSSTPTGVVIFSDQGSSIGQGTLTNSGGTTTASFSTSALTIGSHPITASYSGDSTFLASAASLTQTISQDTTTTGLSASTNSPMSGQTVTFTATISVQGPGAGTPTGSVQFQIDGANVGSPVSISTTGGVTTASFSTSSLAPGTQTISAIYSGDANDTGSSVTMTQAVSQATTMLSVSSSVGPSVSGQMVTFTAALTNNGSSAPTGVVLFSDGGMSIGQGTLSTNGGMTAASFTTSTLSVGTHTITASYGGDGNYQPSMASLTQTVSKGNTAAVVVSSAPFTVSGQTATFTATVMVNSPGSTAVANPTGVVMFSDGSRSMGQGTLSTHGGTTTASFSTSSLTVGSHTITASYGGDSNFLASTAGVTQTVNQAATATSVTSSVGHSAFGQSVSFTATISVQSPGAATPTGTVQFQIDGSNVDSPISVHASGGVISASLSVASLAVGTHLVTAIYSGDTNCTSSSGTCSQVVNEDITTTAVATSVGPSVSGQTVVFTATVNVRAPGAGTPTGVVQFQIDGNNVGSPVNVSTTSGVTTASLTTATLAVGLHTITASYSDDGTFAGSSGNLTQTVNQASSTTVLSPTATSVSGQMITFTVNVTASSPGSTAVANPTGTVIFSDGGTSIGQGMLSTSGGLTMASFSTSSLTVGSHTITASYGGDSNFLASAGTGTQLVGTASTAIAVSSSAAPSVLGQSVTFTASVTINGAGSAAVASPTGSVAFFDNGTSIGQGTLSTSGGVTTASFSTSSLTVGSHTITASYSGDSNFLAGTASLAQAVAHAKTSTTVVSTGSSASGQSVTFTATIAVQNPGAGTPTGTVQFQIDGTNAGSPVGVSTTGGVTTAAFTTAALAVGTHTITATYSGDGGFAGSSSGFMQTVAKARTSVSLGAIAPSVFGQMISFTATVAISVPGSTAVSNPTGVVIFSDGGTSIGQGTLSTSGGVTTASFSTSSLTVGSHTITASYGGDNNFLGSAGTVTQSVDMASTTAAMVSLANPSASGQDVTFMAMITVNAPGSTVVANPTGMVTFFDGTASLGQGTLSTSGGTTTASCTTSSLVAANHTITASYSGDSNFLASTAALRQDVNQAGTTAQLQASASTVAFGQAFTLTASVIADPSSSEPATGSITFLDEGTPLATVPLSGGIASFSTSGLSLGGHTLSAVYAGDVNHLGSSASTVNVTVGTADERFVGDLYQRLLSRPPDAAGLADWVAALARGVSRSQVALAIEQSVEARSDQVQALYREYLHRSADASGLNTFVAYLGAGITVEQVSTILTGSAEYLQVRGGGTNEGFITALYEDALHRQPDANGLAAYTQALSLGASRQQVAAAIFESTEYAQDLVEGFYGLYLKRAADPGGLNAFVQASRLGVTDQAIIAAMLGSDEFFAEA
ncbi:MAG TPA: Ig-like domain repeat protein [Gemmataceae bacterium]|nr:Ig-like domain repeat protein [Gemmataceae bacterium]